ncbi:M3 family metallopeptidase [Janthinobacterium sp. HLX7-2]|uniref:M3 family metallopeptidase n=1 Tax=Janthinobacterium sp. HLX7-2 TaxID=1259331 RepID=UPI003F27DD2E
MTTDNPLLDFSGLPRFDAITAEHVEPAIDTLLAQARATVAQLASAGTAVSWDSFVAPQDDISETLGRAWGIVSHLSNVVDTPELRAAFNASQPKVTEFWTELGQNEALFGKFKQLQASAEFAALSPARKTIVEHAIRGFRLGGAELPQDKKERFGDIQEEHAAVSTRFSENVLDATNDYKLHVADELELVGLPDDVKQAARTAAEKEDKSGYQFTLHFPSFYPILQFADKRSLRETIYQANVTKASELGDDFSKKEEWDNGPNIVTLLKLRDEEAKMLGYKNFAEVSLVPKMAQSPEQVISFLEDLARRARPYAQQDLAELRSFGKEELGLDELNAWDVPYASEKLQERRYAFSAQEVKQYFPEHKVVDGLFRLVQTLFSVNIVADTASAWHPSVRFYRIERDGELVGQFYLDLYARAGKGGGAWMDDARGRRLHNGKLQTPVAYLTCNFTEPALVDGVLQPSLFTHDEVITLFHEFGHGLHHMLTQVDEISVSGISGVEWDAVELPSQFMENFCWEWDVLQHMTAHVTTGEPLPRALYDKMLAAKNFQSGMQTLRHVEFSLHDMHLHYDYAPFGTQTVQDVIDTVRSKFAVLIPPAYNRFQNAFGHIFAGGYAAGYYSYKWAEVLSADAYAAFEEAAALTGGVISAETGKRFQQEILAVGGSRPALESFTAFRGRAPSIDALLRHSGMAA